MKGRMFRTVALVVLVAVLLTGCMGIDFGGIAGWLEQQLAVPFDEMEYVRPDMAGFEEALNAAMEAASTLTSARTVMNKVTPVYQYYYDFITNYRLADIHHSLDMTDSYWEKEHAWCMEKVNVVSAGIDKLLYALADSPVRKDLEADAFFGEGFFDQYDGDSLWDDTFTQLMNEETALINTYYELSAESVELDPYSPAYFDGVGYEMEQIFAQLVAKRQEIARYAGYASYPDFAYEFYFARDYTPAQVQVLVDGIQEELVPLYQNLDADVWAPMLTACSEQEVFNYLKECTEAMGGTAKNAFALMEKAKLYDITFSEKKYDASFEVFLLNYFQPYIFMNPMGNQRDMLTFTHEFGHFCNDYAAGGTVAGVDTAEVFSQGLEYLSLCYGKDNQALTKMKMADSLSVFVEQAAYASFEQQVYALESPTVEQIRETYRQVNQDFGMDLTNRDVREYTMIPHIFIAPMYVISYVVSNDAAMQIYQQERTESGAGLTLWENGLYTMETGFMGFLEEAGLESPFEEGRAQKLKNTFAEIFQ